MDADRCVTKIDNLSPKPEQAEMTSEKCLNAAFRCLKFDPHGPVFCKSPKQLPHHPRSLCTQSGSSSTSVSPWPSRCTTSRAAALSLDLELEAGKQPGPGGFGGPLQADHGLSRPRMRPKGFLSHGSGKRRRLGSSLRDWGCFPNLPARCQSYHVL